ncbi:hypothetical protein [Vibrio jasicida]|uniref:hypothetical protein n=1 Tax=Vibrio jasicida TaxID=766224 RepID=UPI0011B078A5|nr:hypothetical protein [Vibrio jasicida]
MKKLLMIVLAIFSFNATAYELTHGDVGNMNRIIAPQLMGVQVDEVTTIKNMALLLDGSHLKMIAVAKVDVDKTDLIESAKAAGVDIEKLLKEQVEAIGDEWGNCEAVKNVKDYCTNVDTVSITFIYQFKDGTKEVLETAKV